MPPLEILGLVLLCAVLLAAWLWALRVPLHLGHDESAYALQARHWLVGGPTTGVGEHRAPGLPALGLLVLATGAGEAELRLLGVAAGLVAVVGVWWLGRLVADPLAGLLAAATFAAAPTVFGAGSEFLTDLPATAALVLMAGVLWEQFVVREAPGPALVLVAPLAWAAYTFRYGSVLPIALMFGVSAWLFWPHVRAHGRRVVGTLGLLVALLIPHMIGSTATFGTPWGRLHYTSQVAGRDHWGQGLGEYLRWFPSELAGPTVAGLMGLAVVGAAGSLLGRRKRGPRPRPQASRRSLALIYLVAPSIAHVIAVGLVSHGDPRFVFFAVALLCVAGSLVLTDGIRRLAATSPVTARGVLAALLLLTIWNLGTAGPREAGARAELAEEHGIVVDAARALRAMSGTDCSVLTTYNPQVTWYSGCASYHFGIPPAPGRESRLTDDGWMLLFENGKRQPEGDARSHYLALADPVLTLDREVGRGLASATLYRLDADS